MSDMRKIEITVDLKNNVQNSGGDSPKLIGDSGETSLDNIFGSLGNGKGNLIQSVFVNQAYGHAKASVMKTVEYSWNKKLTLTENYKGQDFKANAMTSINKVGSFTASVLGGAMAGNSVGGVGGAMIGGLIGLIGWTVNETIGIYQQKDKIAMDLARTNLQTNWDRTRAGLTTQGRGTEN